MSEKNNQVRPSRSDEKKFGATWADVVLAAPLSLIAVALVIFSCLMFYSIFLADRSVNLGVLGEWGPKDDAHMRGAVVAFAERCPEGVGWKPYTEGEGRTIIGSGAGLVSNLATTSAAAVILSPGSTGGTVLQSKINEVVKPNLSAASPSNFILLLTRSATVARLNPSPDNSEQFYIMPPYVALRWCRKE